MIEERAKKRVRIRVMVMSSQTELVGITGMMLEIFAKRLTMRITRMKETTVARVVSLKIRELRTARK